MAVIENNVLLTAKDSAGNKMLLYPITKLDNVDGAEDLVHDSDLPSSLPNPKKLTLTGAVSATYDGSSAVSVKIPTIAGEPGADGVSVTSVKQTTTSSADGGSNVVTVTLSDGTTSTFTVKNGSKGSTGAAGAKGDTGATGAAGKSAYAYAQDGGYTGTESAFAAKLAEENPTSITTTQIDSLF